MGNLANKFLEAVNIISKSQTEQANYDRSVQATIRILYQEDSTKYGVEYKGAIKTATGAAGYKTGDVVWAVIPGNDSNQVLQIIGLASSIDASKQVLRSEDDEFERITANLATFNTAQTLTSSDKITLWQKGDSNNLVTINPIKMNNAINSSSYFEINAKFESDINITPDTYTDINFGIRCYCDGETIPRFVLDINDIVGNPYYLIEEQQKKIFKVTEEISLNKIEFFVEGLAEKKGTITLTGFSFYGCRDVDYMIGLAANLLVAETGTDFRELGGLSTNNYNLTDADNLIFKANLRYDGILVPENELSKYTYKWYLRTLKDGLPIEIVIGDNPNTKDIVETWYFNKEESDDRIIPSDWFSTIEGAPNQLKVSAAALFMPDSWIWCEVVDEKGNKVKTVEGWIDNADKSYDLSLVVNSPKLQNREYRIYLEIKNGKKLYEENKASFQWIIDDMPSSQLTRYELSYPANGSTIKCKVYTENNFLIFTDSTKLDYIPDAPNMDELSLFITGKSVYLCKADGEFQETTEELKVWAYQNGEQVLLKDGDVTWSIPEKNTMLTIDDSEQKGDTFKFGTKKYLLNSYVNNTITATVASLNATTSIEIVFLKNGWPGTNGTDIICYFEKDGKVLSYYSGNASDITKSNVVVKRASTGATIDIPSDNINLQTISLEEMPMYIKATCTSQDNLSIWYGYLPIVTCSSPADFTLIEPSGVPFVQFSSGGKIADNLPLVFTASKNIADISLQDEDTYFQVEQSDASAKAIISLINDFEFFRGNKDYEILTLTNESGNTITIPILLLTNRFEYATINGWDGTSIKQENGMVLAPVAGFGRKETDKSFTGVVLGNITPEQLVKASALPDKENLTSASVGKIYQIPKTDGTYEYFQVEDTYDFKSISDPTFQGIKGMNQSIETFSLDAKTGDLFAKGHIEAESGKIGGWQINKEALMSKNGEVGFYPDKDNAPITGEDSLLIMGGEPTDIEYPFYWERNNIIITNDTSISLTPSINNNQQVAIERFAKESAGYIQNYTEIITIPQEAKTSVGSYNNYTIDNLADNCFNMNKNNSDIEGLDYTRAKTTYNENQYTIEVDIEYSPFEDNPLQPRLTKNKLYYVPCALNLAQHFGTEFMGLVFTFSGWGGYSEEYKAGTVVYTSKAVNPKVYPFSTYASLDSINNVDISDVYFNHPGNNHTILITVTGAGSNIPEFTSTSIPVYNLTKNDSNFYSGKQGGTITYIIPQISTDSAFNNIFNEIENSQTNIVSDIFNTKSQFASLNNINQTYSSIGFSSFSSITNQALSNSVYESHSINHFMIAPSNTISTNWYVYQPRLYDYLNIPDQAAIVLRTYYLEIWKYFLQTEPDFSPQETIEVTTTFNQHNLTIKSIDDLRMVSTVENEELIIGWPFQKAIFNFDNTAPFTLQTRPLSSYGENGSVISVSYDFHCLLYYIRTDQEKVPGFGVTHEGKLIAQNAFINGDIDAQKLSFTIDNRGLIKGPTILKLFDVNFFNKKYEVVFTTNLEEDESDNSILNIDTSTPLELRIRLAEEE